MAIDYPHLFLKNPKGTSNSFNISRGRNSEDEQIRPDSPPPQNYAAQKSRLAASFNDFTTKRGQRRDARTLHVPDHIDYVKLYFFVLFDDQEPYRTISTFRSRFGLSPVYYEDFNKTITFAIADEEAFIDFITLLSAFINSRNNSPLASDYKIMTIISDFEFITTSKIIKYVNEESVLFELYTSSEIVTQADRISSSLIDYLRTMQERVPSLSFSYLVDDKFLEIENISLDLVQQLTENFDIFHKVQSIKTPRIRPSEEGLEIRDYGFESVLVENAPLVGVLDTGVRRIAPLANILHSNGYDATTRTPNPNLDLAGHGTSVAGLVAFGLDFYKSNSSSYNAFARIFPIKILQDSEGIISVKNIVSAIRQAHLEYGIRLFNLSVNECISKFYNSSVSEYAYALDKISYELDVLIFISAGNLGEEDIRNLKANDTNPFHVYPNHFFNPYELSDFHACEQTNICPPADSFNNMTVGAIADNLRDEITDMTLDKKLPAFYSRKFHYDYHKKINGSLLKQNQTNFKIFKPDIILPGGDVMDERVGIQVLGPGNAPRTYYKFASGTSFSTPLATNIAAKILQKYSALNMQSVKALIINSSSVEYDSTFLYDSINNIKEQAANELFGNAFSTLATKEKKKLNALLDPQKLMNHLCGHGQPNVSKCITSSANSITVIIQDTINSNSHKIITINLPDYLNGLGNEKSSLLSIKATLCFKFDPVLDNHLAYCPVHISFNFIKCLNDIPDENANIIANRKNHPYFNQFYTTGMSPKEKLERRDAELGVQARISSWSDDFFPLNAKPFANVQKNEILIRPKDLNKIGNKLSVVVRAINKSNLEPEFVRALESRAHEFSIVLTIEERNGFREGRIYQELLNVNELENIVEISDLNADLETEI